MGIVFRQSAKNSLVVFAGALLGALILWLSQNYIPDQHSYGFTQYIIFWAATSSQFMLVGLNSTLVVFIHKFNEDAGKKKLLLTLTLLIPLLLTAIYSVVFYLLRDNFINNYKGADIELTRRFFIWFPISTLIFVYMTILEQYLGSQMKVALSSFMREIVLRLLNIAVLLLFAFGYISFDLLVALLMLIYALPIAIFIILCFQTPHFGFTFEFGRFSKSEYKEMLHFTWYHFLLNITLILLGYLDILMLPALSKEGHSATAIYRIAQFLIVIVQMPFKALQPASFTVLAQAFAEDNIAKAKDLFSRASLNMLIPTIGVSIILFCNLHNATAILSKGYEQMAPVFLILLVGFIVNIATGMNDQVLTIANYYKFNFALSVILLAVVYALLRVLVPEYGIYGAAWSTTITYSIFNLVKYLFVKRKLGMEPFSRKTLLVIVASIPALAAGYFFPYFFNPARHIFQHSFYDGVMRSTVIIVVYLLMLWWLKPSPDLSEYIASVKKNKRLF